MPGYRPDGRLPEFREIDEDLTIEVSARLAGRGTGQVLEGTPVEQQRRVHVGLELFDKADDKHVVSGAVHVPRHAPEVRAAPGEVRNAGPHWPLAVAAGRR